MADWDDEEFEPEDPTKVQAPARTDKWEGEDEDDEVKDAWDVDSDEEKKADTPEGNEEGKAIQKKKKKKLADKIAEKEEAQMREMEALRLQKEEEERLNTPEGKLAEKLRLQKLEESNQLELAKDMMGIKDDDKSGVNFTAESKEEFDQLSSMLLEKMRDLESSPHYQDFAAQLISGICMNLAVPTLKKVKGEVEAFTSAKLKEERANKTKKAKPGKASIRMETDRSMFGRGLDEGYDDMDDFM